MRGKWALFGGIAVLVAAAAGALSLWRPATPDAAKVAVPAAKPALPPGAEVSIQGKVEARQIATVQAPSDGTIVEYMVNVGDEVFEGQLLARISDPTLENEREAARQKLSNSQERLNAIESQVLAARLEATRARAEVARIQEDFNRYERLYQKQAMLNREGATPRLTYERTKQDYDTIKLEYDAANGRAQVAESRVAEFLKDLDGLKKAVEEQSADLEQAESDLQATQLHAPADGIILARKGDNGVQISRGEDDILRIGTDLGQLAAILEPEPPVLSRLKPGLPALVIVAERASEPLNGEIQRIENGKVYVDFASPDPSIKPGVTAQVRLKLP